ncbi:hypothetical protein [Nocardia otitidiscaviarum]|nr:hypothetical protein [Nocardia otitidiscaviarum]MBF6177835.1 hypothetical protein [Nocardia otitidiscaviarum]
MYFRKLSAAVLTVATVSTGLLVATPFVGGESVAHALPGLPLPPGAVPGPVDTWAMGDTLNCYVDYTLWVDRDQTDPHRVIAHIQPRGIRPTIPGTEAPATCSVTLVPFSSTDRNPWNLIYSRLDRIDADRTGGAPVQFDLPYQQDATWVTLNTVPITAFTPVSVGSSPFWSVTVPVLFL